MDGRYTEFDLRRKTKIRLTRLFELKRKWWVKRAKITNKRVSVMMKYSTAAQEIYI